jgi:hypothetical protein
MKKILLLVAVFTSALVQGSFAQNTKTPEFLNSYYSLKNALVSGDAQTANKKAVELGKSIEVADSKIIGNKEKAELLKHSRLISGTEDIKVQRAHFATLSNSIIALAKSSKLTTDPIYIQYCPMKKSSWLSSEKLIKNPYYGSAMLTCGKITQTIN